MDNYPTLFYLYLLFFFECISSTTVFLMEQILGLRENKPSSLSLFPRDLEYLSALFYWVCMGHYIVTNLQIIKYGKGNYIKISWRYLTNTNITNDQG